MNSLSSVHLAKRTAGLLGLLATSVALALPVAAQMKPQVGTSSSSKPAETTVPTTPSVSGSTTSGSTTSGSTTPTLPTLPNSRIPSTGTSGSGMSGSGMSGSGMSGSGMSGTSGSGMSGTGTSGTDTSGTDTPSSSGTSGSGMSGSGTMNRMTPPNSPVSAPNIQTPSQPTLPNTQTPGSRTSPSSQAPSTQPGTSATSGRTIVDVASASNTFKTLVAALNEAELAEVLKGQGPFTVFAPTDAAFAALPPGTVDQLLKPENRATLVKILKYHVVAGDYPSNRLTSGQVPTAEGSPVTVSVKDGKVKVNDANVIQPDIVASNGVIHAIDRVILPPR